LVNVATNIGGKFQYILLEPIEKIKAKQRQQLRKGEQPGASVEKLPQLDEGKSRDKIAEKLGVSGKQYDKIKTVRDKAPTYNYIIYMAELYLIILKLEI